MLELAILSMLESCSTELLLNKNSNIGDDRSGVILLTAEDVLSIFEDSIDGDNDDDNLLLEMIGVAVDRATLSVVDSANVVLSILVESC